MASHNSKSLKSFNYPNRYMAHRNRLGVMIEVNEDSPDLDKQDATFCLVPSLACPDDPMTISFQSVNYPDSYLRHQNYRLKLAEPDGSQLFKEDATFKLVSGNAGSEDCGWVSFESFNYPNRFIRHRSFELWVESGDSDLFRADSTFMSERPFWKE